MDFMANELQYRNYRKFSGQHTDACALFNRFFNCRTAASTESFLQVSEPIIEQLKSSTIDLMDPMKEFQSDCFDRIAMILLQYFSKTYFPQFLESNHFNEYVQNCDRKLKCLQNHRQKLMKQQSSSLSIDDNENHKFNSLNMTNQTDQLWNRDLKDRLQFTYIDKYGRMNSTLEPEPPRSSPGIDRSKLSKFFGRLSFGHNSANRIESEDDAWRIAESIINDVCSVTNRQQQPSEEEHPIEFNEH
ncbi:hypothetical protein BLA29_007690 [Euroglyphus maynei]|uniref:RGS domain-containing protein n=1 Tax=Euroglyphus maynei TaxID=6958 RepID=A0A1Y3AW53_EURMA|nr:hypothetical protein BLA29_007690 [Euroglyphus maynei]